MDDTKHPLPWRKESHLSIDGEIKYVHVIADNNAVVSSAWSFLDDDDQDAAYELIVRCVNGNKAMADELRSTVSSLRQVVVALEVLGLGREAVADAVVAIQDRLAAALAEPPSE